MSNGVKYQQTQIYGNLMYKHPPHTKNSNYKNFLYPFNFQNNILSHFKVSRELAGVFNIQSCKVVDRFTGSISSYMNTIV